MLLFVALTIIWVTGLLTVSSETFTHFLTKPSLRELLRGFVEQSILFTLTAVLWAVTILLVGWWLEWPLELRTLIGMLGFAHLPLLFYPLTVAPSIGYRLEQLLWFSVILALVIQLMVLVEATIVEALLAALPGWLAHLFLVEWRVLRRQAL